MRHAILLVALALMACETEADLQAAAAAQRDREFADATTLCQRQHAEGALKTWGERGKCISTAQTDIFARYGYPYMDIIQLVGAKRIQINSQQDKGNLSQADADVLWAQVILEATTEIQRRDQIAYEQRLRRAAIFAEYYRPYTVPQPQPTYQPPQIRSPTTTNCYWQGTMLQCTTY